MGAEREDTDLTAKRTGTEPGLGKGSGATPAAAPPAASDAPPPVDFDALHAALGDPLDYVEMGSGPALEKGNPDELDDGDDDIATGPGIRVGVGVGESSGRSSATYASARPHTIPPTRAPIEDLNAPAVIVATDTDTVPTAPPNMTVPLSASPHAAQFGRVPGVARGSTPHIAMGSGPHGSVPPPHPGSNPPAASPSLGVSYGHTPQPMPVQSRGGLQMTMRMPDRPVNARRGKTPTIVVRPRGPSTKQRLFAFMAMLLLVTACGIAVIVWRKPHWLGLDMPFGAPSAAPLTPVPVAPPATLGTPSASGTSSTSSTSSATSTSGTDPTNTPVGPNSAMTSSSSGVPAGSASASAASSASVKKAVKPPPPTPLPAPAHPVSSAPSSRL